MFDTTKTAEQTQFNEIRKEKGLRAALDWRDALFKEEDERGYSLQAEGYRDRPEILWPIAYLSTTSRKLPIVSSATLSIFKFAS